jgi:hypothetical protein
MFAYTVSCTFDDPNVANEWLAWLRDEHLAEVLAAGARDAEVIRFDGLPVRCEVRYHFDSRDDFAKYEHAHAPALRAKGLERFPAMRGIKYERSTGVVAIPQLK